VAHTAEDLVALLKSTNSPFVLASHFSEFGEELENLVGRLEKVEKTLADLGKRLAALEVTPTAAPKAASKAGA
jgi:hypothetical protein